MNTGRRHFLVGLLLLLASSIFSQATTTNDQAYYFQTDLQKSILAQDQLRSGDSVFEIDLPLSDGTILPFIAVENQVLSEEIKQEFPANYSLDLICKDNPQITGKLAIGQRYVVGTIYTPKETHIINPSRIREGNLLVYNTLHNPEIEEHILEETFCTYDQNLERLSKGNRSRVNLRGASSFGFGGQRRVYRMAITTPAEFYNANGGNPSDALAAVNFGINSINTIYSNELNITFTLAGSPFFYTDENTDPFDPTSGIGRETQAATGVNLNFDRDDYDIGHVLNNSNANAWSGGGVALLESVCNLGTRGDGFRKAAGWSGSSYNLSGQMILIFAHEVGHMFGAEHTWNGEGFGCDTSQLALNNAYEIASGTTIMSYNGLCASIYNIPSFGLLDNYFHAASLTQMINYIDSDPIGGSCPSRSPANNDIPRVDASPEASTYNIPIETPFELTGAGYDLDSDNLTYCWEQFDEDGTNERPAYGDIGADAADNALAPLFRSFPPSSNPTRIFPSLEKILTGMDTSLAFEALPAINRTMNFVLTVRDNDPNGGAVACDNITINVENTPGSFRITSQNTATNLVANGSNTFTITWDVNDTDNMPINATQVDILFSMDGGLTFPFTLAGGTANDGMETITVPDLPTTQGRIKIKPVDNIFFDINNAAITITSLCVAPTSVISSDNALVDQVGAASLDISLSSFTGTFSKTLTGTLTPSSPLGQVPIYDIENNNNCETIFNRRYVLKTFMVTEAGEYRFQSNNSNIFTALYNSAYNPSSGCTNLITSSLYGNIVLSYIENDGGIFADLSPGNTYVLAAFGLSGTPTFEISMDGPGQIFMETAFPASVNYTYVIVDTESGNIIDFEDDPDLLNAVKYVGGCYEVFGLAYENSTTLMDLQTNYNGTSFAAFQTLSLSSSLCAILSNNKKEVTILSCGAEAGALNNPSALTAYEDSPVLNLSLAPNYSGTSDPGSDYSYTYAIVDAGDLSVQQFVDVPDLSSSATYPAGEYLIYGISYLNTGANSTTTAGLNTAFQNEPIGALLDSVQQKDWCLDLSSNTKPISILTCQNPSSTIVSDTFLRDTFNQVGLDLDLMPLREMVTSTVSGNIDASDAFASFTAFSNGGGCDTLVLGLIVSGYLDSFRIRPTVTGTYNFSITRGGQQTFNLYQGTYDPNDICNNWLGSTFRSNTVDGGVLIYSGLSINLVANQEYIMIMQANFGESSNQFGAYSINITGPGNMDLIEQVPDDYNYAYVIIDNEMNTIEEIVDDADLSDGTTYPVGFFTIHGLAYESSTTTTAALSAGYSGNTLSTLQNAITNGIVCGTLSSNTKLVEVINDDLPVDLLSFEATNLPQQVQLDWTTASEQNNLGFFVQRSADGINWASIAWLDGAGTTNEQQYYQDFDPNPLDGTSFYRLQQQDIDGALEYSEIRSVTRSGSQLRDWALFPNPGTGQYTIVGDFETGDVLLIRNELGQLVASLQVDKSRRLDLSGQVPGVYYVTLKSDQKVWTKRLIQME